MEQEKLKYIIEAALLAAEEPLTRNQLSALFPEEQAPSHKQISEALGELVEDYEPRGICLQEVASGFRLQIDGWAEPWISGLWRERPPKYSRALLETLALIAYRQPITRGEIEKVRGVSVSSNIMRTLIERDWVRVVGHRDVPGRPALYGTNKAFLDYFGLKSLDDLPTLAEIRDIEADPELDLEGTLRDAAAAAAEAGQQEQSASPEARGDENAAEREQDDNGNPTQDSGTQEISSPEQQPQEDEWKGRERAEEVSGQQTVEGDGQAETNQEPSEETSGEQDSASTGSQPGDNAVEEGSEETAESEQEATEASSTATATGAGG